MDFDETLKVLKEMLNQADELRDEYYFRWTELSAKEFPCRDADGNYIIYKEKKPSAQLKKARKNLLAIRSVVYDLNRTIFDFAQMIETLKEE